MDESGNPSLISIVDPEMERKLNIDLAELELNVPALNCEDELLEVRNFDETTLKKVKLQLQARGLVLGMKSAAGKR